MLSFFLPFMVLLAVTVSSPPPSANKTLVDANSNVQSSFSPHWWQGIAFFAQNVLIFSRYASTIPVHKHFCFYPVRYVITYMLRFVLVEVL